MRLRICVVSEAIKSPFDEGVKIFVYHFIKELAKNHDVLGLSRAPNFEGDIEKYCAKALPKNRLFVSFCLWRKIKAFEPDIICYIPTAHATIYSFLRAKVLKLYYTKSRTVLITLQPRAYSSWSKRVIPLIVADLVFAQSTKTKELLERLGCMVKMIPSGVDLEKFTPASKELKEKLRNKYAIPINKYIVLHVGHINRNRNMQFMEDIQSLDGSQAVVVGSTTYPEDLDLIRDIQAKGVITITGYIEKIEELYQCADCYVFPVFSEGACIEIPLSILEAMACNLPVVSTRFGGLGNFINEGNGLFYVNAEDEIMAKIQFAKNSDNPRTRNMVEKFAWQNVVQEIVVNSFETR